MTKMNEIVAALKRLGLDPKKTLASWDKEIKADPEYRSRAFGKAVRKDLEEYILKGQGEVVVCLALGACTKRTVGIVLADLFRFPVPISDVIVYWEEQEGWPNKRDCPYDKEKRANICNQNFLP